MEITEIYSHCFWQKIRETNIYLRLKALLNKWFDEIFFLVRVNFDFFSTVHTVEITDIYSTLNEKIFRQIT